MKLPQKSEISDCIIRHSFRRVDKWGSEEHVLDAESLGNCATELAEMFMRLNLEDDHTEKAPDIDPNLVKIAELEAKIMVYESVISGAGIRLSMPKKKQQ